MSDIAPAPPRTWPSGCHDPDSCARHRRCMYIQCEHKGRDISAQIDAATSALLGREQRP